MNASLARAENPLKPDVGAKDERKPGDNIYCCHRVCNRHHDEHAYHHKAVGGLE